MTKVDDLHKKWAKDPKYRKANDALAAEFELVRAVVNARAEAGLSQTQLARKMETSAPDLPQALIGAGVLKN